MKRLLLVLFCLVFLSGCANKKSMEKPEGIIPEDINVPQAVLDAAVNKAREKYGATRQYERGNYDNWKIESLEHERLFENFEGYDVDTYPEKMYLVGDMSMEDDWVRVYSGKIGLAFNVTGGGEPVYMFEFFLQDTGPNSDLFELELAE